MTAARLAGEASLGDVLEIERLSGGKNNRVYRVALKEGQTVALKLYHTDQRDRRDRLSAEWSFLAYAWERGVRNVPRPLAHDPRTHAGLYGFVPGRRLSTDEIGPSAVRQAADFVIAVNGAPRQPERLEPGSEACFSLADHLATVDRRVARLDSLDNAAPFAAEAQQLVANRLRPAWDRARAGIVDGAGRERMPLDAAIGSICVSPSDFGYHNALTDSAGRLTFIDFEYAGRDDPAKLVCDFFCQPEVPVSLDHFETFVAALEKPLGLGGADLWRCRALLPAYRIKWVCIILNEFLAVGANRRAFADDGDRPTRARRQIERADRYLDVLAS